MTTEEKLKAIDDVRAARVEYELYRSQNKCKCEGDCLNACGCGHALKLSSLNRKLQVLRDKIELGVG